MIARSILLILFNTIYQINCLNPYPSISTKDSVSKTGNTLSKFAFQVGFNILVAFACVMNIFCASSEPVGLVEYILFSMAVFGTMIRFRAYHDLGHFYTFDLVIKEDHKLITYGIYKYIRHPGNLGSLMVTIPLWIFTNVNVYFTSAIMIYTIYVFWVRVRCEEAMMVERFGQEYRDYVGKTWGFVPWVRHL